MPVETNPEDYPAAVRFRIAEDDGAFQVSASLLAPDHPLPYRIDGGEPRFPSRDAFKAKAAAAGLTPSVAEDPTRSFNATARQLRELGFSVELLHASS
jgi:hypothetical protein